MWSRGADTWEFSQRLILIMRSRGADICLVELTLGSFSQRLIFITRSGGADTWEFSQRLILIVRSRGADTWEFSVKSSF
ncbi:hypothetical protein RRG08_037234 [Elysia crispata]|uniref:Uncharacterized protein n=1 Tax=Elysia crispata TaxID=231223 RepID=A0AAE1DRN7_9GAST|nr:hypothetical protein RRG08_037234 [Elysia crispata]